MALAAVECLSFYQLARLAPSFPLVLSSRSFLLLFLLLYFLSYIFLECRRRGATSRLRRRLGSGGGGHHARGCAGSRRLPPQRPARALPHPGPHAPILKKPLGGVGGRSAKRREEAPKAGLLPQWPELIEMRREGWRPSFYGAAAANEVPFRPGGIRYESGPAWC